MTIYQHIATSMKALKDALAGKASTTHTHTIIDGLSDVVVTTPADNELMAYNAATSQWINQTPAEAGLAVSSHTHTIADVTNLQTTLNSKLSSIPNATDLVVGGVKARVDAVAGALYLTNDGTNP